jgi:hypothetical protein
MDAGSRSQMSPMGVPTPGLGQRRATQRITPLPLGELRPSADVDAGAPTPRTSRSHLLAGLRTAPRTSTATNFPASPTVPTHGQHQAAFGRAGAGAGADGYYNAPRTAHPFSGGGSLQQQAAMAGYTTAQPLQQQQQQQQPPEIRIQDGQDHQMDTAHMAILLAQQQQQIEQQLQALQLLAVQQQQQMLQARADGSLSQQRQQRMYAQQMQIAQLQNQLAAAQLPGMYYADPNQALLMAQMADAGMQGVPMAHLAEQQQQMHNMQQLQQLQQLQFQQQQQQQQLHHHHQQQLYANQMQGSAQTNASRAPGGFRSGSPPKRFEPSADAVPLPPPSANAFRRAHKKTPSLALGTVLAAVQDAPRSAGPRTPSFPQSGHGPGQGRAGEHPTRQPRGPPPMEELAARPTSRHEGSKNFAARARRSAVSSLVRAGLDRRSNSGSAASSASSSVAGGSGASSPTLLDRPLIVQVPAPAAVADALVHSPTEDSDSERSGSGSLAGDADVECSLPSSRSSSSSTYGAIGSDRPSSRQKSRQSVDSVTSVATADSAGAVECCDDGNTSTATTAASSTFANVFKKAALPREKQAGEARKAKLVLTRSGSTSQA